MDLDSETMRIGLLLDDFARRSADSMRTAACDDPEDSGASPEMRVGAVDSGGWVSWRVLPSRVTIADLHDIEGEFVLRIPTALKAYLLSRSHLFDQLRSRKHQQLLLMSDTPVHSPLRPFRRTLRAWLPLARAGFIPFGEWGDGWGPMCFDVRVPGALADDAPIVWFEHELLVPLGEQACADRALVAKSAQPLYDSFLSLLSDVLEDHEAPQGSR